MLGANSLRRPSPQFKCRQCRQMPALLLPVLFFSGCQAISSHTLFCVLRGLLEMIKELKIYVQFVSVVLFPVVVFNLIVLCAVRSLIVTLH